MKKKYEINKVNDLSHCMGDGSNNLFLSIDWSLAEEGYISCYPWADGLDSYQPNSRFFVLYDVDSLYVLLLTQGKFEVFPRTEEHGHQAPVHQDSCLEIFFSPLENEYFYNFECNSKGAYKIAYGTNQKPRYLLNEEELDEVVISPLRSRDVRLTGVSFEFDWGVFLRIPRSLFSGFVGQEVIFSEGNSLATNAYKCGDLTAEAHFGCWSPIENEVPNFHMPEFFGEFMFV